MLNKMKARLLIGLGGLAVTSFMVMMGYTIGSQSVTNHTQKQIQTEAHKLLTKEKEKEKGNVLSDELVKEFLTQYYTKEKLGENNNRIIYLAKHEKGIDSLIEIIRKWDDSIDTADLDLDILEKYFLNLSDYFFEKFDEIVYRTDMVFVLPMVNKTSVDLLNIEFQLRLSKPVLRQIYDFSGYYGIGGGKDFETMLRIISDRASENSILDSLSLNFTLDTKSPYVRLPNLPSQDITVWYSHMFKNTMKNANLSEIEKFNNNFHKISEKLKLSLDDEFIDILVKYG